ncbi:unnamed protein product [Gongylonema pulchrum]|uniref:DUF1754-domain-containing protein n=1 Tax=Gongylonema pulchrum TaxID=637853 RepID=A0A183DSM8_9BILA|nr:unnamed protein product [Gongylonema pulchrum]
MRQITKAAGKRDGVLKDVTVESEKEPAGPNSRRSLNKLISKARRTTKSAAGQREKMKMQASSREVSDLEKEAKRQILKEAERAVKRYEVVGPQGW